MILMGIKFISLALVFVLVCCTTPADSSGRDATSIRFLAIEPADYSQIAWVDENTLVLTWNPPALPDGRNQGSRLVAVELEGTDHRPLPHFVANDRCHFIEERSPTPLSDGRIGFLRDCYLLGLPEETIEIGAMDVDTGEEAIVASLGEVWLPDGRAVIGGFSYPDGSTNGVLDIGDVMCGGVARFDATGCIPSNSPYPNLPAQTSRMYSLGHARTP